MGADQAREGIIAAIVRADRVVNVIAVIAGVLVANPAVDCKTASGEMQPLHRLAENRIREPAMHPELDDRAWPQRVDNPEAERRMLEPGRTGDEIRCPPRHLRDERIRAQRRELAQLNVHCRSGCWTRYAHAPPTHESTL